MICRYAQKSSSVEFNDVADRVEVIHKRNGVWNARWNSRPVTSAAELHGICDYVSEIPNHTLMLAMMSPSIMPVTTLTSMKTGNKIRLGAR